MTKQTLFNLISLAVILISFSYVAVLQNKVNATEELLALEQEEAQLRMEIKEDEDGWRVDEYWKTECVESFEKSQFNRHTRNDKRRARLEQIEEEKGLILNR